MRIIRYSINVTRDGCCDHRDIIPNEAIHRHATENIEQADALLFGRITYGMMEEGWRYPVPANSRPEWMEPFARTIDAKKKYVVSSTLQHVEWNSELVQGDLETVVRALKNAPGGMLLTGGVTLPTALAKLGLIDEYDLVVQDRIVGHGPYLLAGLPQALDLELVSRENRDAGTIAMRYVPRR